MSTLSLIILCSLTGGVFSLIGGITLSMNKKSKTLASYATAFAAGALLAAAFMDLLPEAVEQSNPQQAMLFAMCGLIFFFLLEGAIHWFHKHADKNNSNHPINTMIIIGDTIHNFIDGAAIAAGFLVSPISGIIVTLAVVAHEIPQEIADFGILLHNSMSRKKAILINIFSAIVATLSAVIFFLLGNSINIDLSPLLGIVAGFFIYIAATDIIPTIHQEKDRRIILKKSIWMIIGTVLVSLLIVNLHAYAHNHSGNEQHSHSSEHIEHNHHHHNDDEIHGRSYIDHDHH
jgi:Predicted divalent heavy-metal cations transporter